MTVEEAMHRPGSAAAVIGGGPAGLMAAETLAAAGMTVTVYDRMPTVGRKFLMAGRGGLNLTHSEPLDAFLDRYGPARAWLEPAIRAFPPDALIAWCQGLGQETFVGSSGRVFPRAMKASPLLRAWLGRLAGLNVRFRTRHRWTGWSPGGALGFDTPAGPAIAAADVTILALGGASWPRLGGDGGWSGLVADVEPFRPANCGFLVDWSDRLRDMFAGQPLKRIAISFQDRTVRGEATIAASGIEGGAVYALSAAIRDAIAAAGPVRIHIDLRPDLSAAALAGRLNVPRRGQSLTSFLRRQAGLPPVAIALVHEAIRGGADPTDLAGLVQAVPVTVRAAAALDRAISSAGGLRRDGVDDGFMLRARPGVFAVGEMLDWEAPTGGYLLQACFSTAVWAARAALTREGRR